MDTPKKNDVVTLKISGYGSDAAGISRLEDGRVVFVKGALDGETCQVQLLKVGKSAVWGRAVETKTDSAARQTSDCSYYPCCGGCQTRHMTYEEELRFKKSRVEEALRRIGGVESAVVTEIYGASQPLRYRNKVQFPVSSAQEGIHIGFYRQRSHDVIDVDDCLLQPQEATRLRAAVKQWMQECGVQPYDELRHKGLVRHVFVRTNRDGKSLCAIVANGKKLPQEARLVNLLQEAEPALQGIVLSINREKTNVILGKHFRTIWGADTLEDTLCNLQFRLSVPSFYQVNRRQTEVLYGKAVDMAGLTGSETVLDLYCGIGTISLSLAQRAKQVYGAEVVPEAVQDAWENAQRNGVENVSFFCGDAGDAAQKFAKEGIRPQVVCVDPPRKGLAPQVIDTIAELSPERVVYVSCDPATLARDVKLFTEKGYQLQEAIALDMFPRTVHVETCVLLSNLPLMSRI